MSTAANILPITNVISVTSTVSGSAVGEYNTSNVALFTTDAPQASFGSNGYALYLSPTQVATDFGSSSQTYSMANALFSQAPNILANNGYLAIIPYVSAVQTLTFSGVAASGTFDLDLPGGNATGIEWNATASSIQTSIQALTGYSQVQVSGSIASESLVITFYGVYGPVASATIANNTLETSGAAAITVTVAATTAGETINDAITRTENLIQYFGIISQTVVDQTDILAAAATVQALNKIMLYGSNTQADIAAGGTIDLLRTGNFTQTRGLYYGSTGTSATLDLLEFVAAYAGRAFSTNFSGSNTCQSMHLKQLATINPDPTITQTILTTAGTAGADCYVSINGYSCVYSSGANQFFDQVYNLQWFTGAISTAGFNYLAGTSSKIPQTEPGMTGLKGAYRQVCVQAVANGYVAPGSWNSATTFGDQSKFLNNISQYGFYIYSTPVSQQSETDRTARQAPLVQIALKEAGSVNSSDVLVVVNE